MHYAKLAPLFLLALPALAAPAPEEAANIIARCSQALAADDAEQLAAVAREMADWDALADPALQARAEFCLEVAAARLGEDAPAPAAPADMIETEAAEPEVVDPGVARYLRRANRDDPDMAALAETIIGNPNFAPAPSSARDDLEAALLAYVRPLPAARAEANLAAYKALLKIVPDNATYAAKVAQYNDAIHATGQRVARSLIKTTAEFDGSSWSRHPSSPRYQDIRNYVTLYLLEDARGNRDLELFVNYTADDGWLFVESAVLNIDGDRVRLPSTRWARDNDTEIWEFASFEGSAMISLAQRIADSDRAVIRFNGQQFYDDHVITSTEKRVIREMLQAFAYLKAE